MDAYDDIVRDTLNHHDDQTNLLMKNILKKDKGFGGRDSVISSGQRHSYTSRFSSKYGDNRLYLQRLSRNSIDSSSQIDQNGQYKMKIRPKPRKYGGEELEESYFAVNSNEGKQNLSRDETADESDFFDTQKREFKIYDKTIEEKGYSTNEIKTAKYSA